MAALNICDHQQAGVVLRTSGRMPEYSIGQTVNADVLIELAKLTLASRGMRSVRQAKFGQAVVSSIPKVPPPHAPFVSSSIAMTPAE